MPKEKDSLFNQAEALNTKADELLKLKRASNSFQILSSSKYEVQISELELKRSKDNLAIYEYERSKIDKEHPNYDELVRNKKATIENVQGSIVTAEGRLKRAIELLASTEIRVKKEIEKIESNELLPSSMDKSALIKELLNKMSYGL